MKIIVKQNKKSEDQINFERFFGLLLEIDKRNNPNLYTKNTDPKTLEK